MRQFRLSDALRRRQPLFIWSRSKELALMYVSGFYVGASPLVPGTVGSLWGIVLWWAVGGGWIAPLIAIAFLIITGIPAVTTIERSLGVEDRRIVVLDEVIGMAITMLGIPAGRWDIAVIGFVAFRVFDIFKPFSARAAERLHGGLGVILDDVFAGIYGFVVVQLLYFVMR